MKCSENLFDLMNKDEKFLFHINGRNFYGINNTPSKYSEFINKLIEDTEDSLHLEHIKTRIDNFTASDGSDISITVFTKEGRRVFCIEDRKMRQDEFTDRYKGDKEDLGYNYNGEEKGLGERNYKADTKTKKEGRNILIGLLSFPLVLIFIYYKEHPQELQNILNIFR